MQVDGAAGVGKTRLLAEAEGWAADLGFSLATGHTGDLPEALRLARLSAGVDGEPPREVEAGARPVPSEMEAGLPRLAAQVRELASRSPILVALDDLQWTEESMVLGLRALLVLLADHPVGWVLARRTGVRSPTTDLLDELWQSGAVRIELRPLPSDAVADVIADRLQARPDRGLLSLAGDAAGNPQLLVALVDGLCEEGAVAVADGRARLLSRRIPQRVDDVIREWVEQLSPGARNLLEVAAILDRSFDVDDLARVYGRPTDQLLAPLRELDECDLLTSVGNGARAFHHDLVRQSVALRVPVAVRSALSSHPQKGTRTDSGSAPGARSRPAVAGRTAGPTRDAIWEESTAVHDEQRNVESGPSPVEQASNAWAALTHTEQVVAELVARGLTNREVAARVFLSPHTVSFHLRKVYRKLGVGSRVELARLSIELERHASVGDPTAPAPGRQSRDASP
jgi:DNA-binding CsgD family transcriptional regulator